MVCNNCGSTINDGEKFCGSCGSPAPAPVAPVAAPAPVAPEATPAPVAAPVTAAPQYEAALTEEKIPTRSADEPALSLRKFLKLPENNKIKSNINSAGIICYICAVLTLVVSLVGGGLNFVDPTILLILGLFIQIGCSVIASFILTAYGIFNVIYMIAVTGKLGGWLVPVAGVIAVIYTIKAKSAYKKYLKGA